MAAHGGDHAAQERRVLMIGPSLRRKGGIVTVEKCLLANWPAGRWKIRHIASVADGPRWRKLIQAIVALVRFLYATLSWKPHVAHIHFSSRASFWRKSVFVLLAKVLGARVLGHAHGSEFNVFYGRECGPMRKAFIKTVINRMDALVAVSSLWREFYRGIYRRHDTDLVYNSIGVPADLRHREGTPPVVLTLGRLGRRKGTYDILEAVPVVLRSHPDAQFWLGGDGDVEEVQEILGREPWGGHVRVLGWISGEEKREALSGASIFLLPSYHEGLPLAVLEAMAYGLPVVSTPVGGIPEAVVDGETGFLVQPGGVDAIAARVCDLLRDPVLRDTMGRLARERAGAKFEVGAAIGQIIAIYEQLLGGKDTRRCS